MRRDTDGAVLDRSDPRLPASSAVVRPTTDEPRPASCSAGEGVICRDSDVAAAKGPGHRRGVLTGLGVDPGRIVGLVSFGLSGAFALGVVLLLLRGRPGGSLAELPELAPVGHNGADVVADSQNPTWAAPKAGAGLPRLWLVVPAYNEELRLGGTLEQYRGALGPNDRLVIVVNGSVDRTEELARSVAGADTRLTVLVEPRRVGKGGALIIGFQYVAGHADNQDVVAYTDADAAVSGPEIVRFSSATSPQELRVGSRWRDPATQLRRQPLLRQVAGRAFNYLVRRLLDLEVADTQCSAKALVAAHLPAVVEHLDCTGFAFDVDLIMASRRAGLKTTEVPVVWSDKAGSTVSMRRAAPAMVRELLKLRRKYKAAGPDFAASPPRYQLLAPAIADVEQVIDLTDAETDRSHHDAPSLGDGAPSLTGVAAPANQARRAGADHAPSPASSQVMSLPQKLGAIALVLGATCGLIIAPIITLVALNAAIIVFFTAANVVKLDLVRRSMNDRSRQVIDLTDPPRIPDDDLPVYTILLPLYHESSILRQLIDGITALDYPMSKLDVKLILEPDDDDTRTALNEHVLPASFEIVPVSDTGPTGKPRACNSGLARALGHFLVIYDAEDRPEPDQLRKAVQAFRDVPADVVCMQAKLNYFNRTHNLLTRWFTSEYSLWFDQLLPGLQSMDVAIPLGGTSNHFITERLQDLGGWDPFNVTEDADLGLRIYLSGGKTTILDSTTYEEATSRYHNWIRQRSRWVKGYMQTYLHHTRNPIALARQMGRALSLCSTSSLAPPPSAYSSTRSIGR